MENTLYLYPQNRREFFHAMGSYQSGQMGLTVTQLAKPSVVRIHHCPRFKRGNSSVDRALAFQAGGRGFESRFPLSFTGSYESDYLFYFVVFRGLGHLFKPRVKPEPKIVFCAAIWGKVFGSVPRQSLYYHRQ